MKDPVIKDEIKDNIAKHAAEYAMKKLNENGVNFIYENKNDFLFGKGESIFICEFDDKANKWKIIYDVDSGLNSSDDTDEYLNNICTNTDCDINRVLNGVDEDGFKEYNWYNSKKDEIIKRSYIISNGKYVVGAGYSNNSYKFNPDIPTLVIYFGFIVLHLSLWNVLGFESYTSDSFARYLFFVPVIIYLLNIYFSDAGAETFGTELTIHDTVISSAATFLALGLTMTFFGNAVKEKMRSNSYSEFLYLIAISFVIGIFSLFYIRIRGSSKLMKYTTIIKNGFIILAISYLATTVAGAASKIKTSYI